MRLFVYYAFHTIVNTLKKLLKTWVAFFIVITLVVQSFWIAYRQTCTSY